MEEANLSLAQNLCAARLFLSMFDLLLEEKTIIDGDYKFGVLKDNSLVGTVYVTEEMGRNNKLKKCFKIDCQTSLGRLAASYDAIQVQAFKDDEEEGNFAIWTHQISYNIDGPRSFKGFTQIDISIDSDKKKVKIRIQDGGFNFDYVASKDEFKETLQAEPYNIINGIDLKLMYHSVQAGKCDDSFAPLGRYRDEKVYFLAHNGSSDKNHLRFGLYEVENYEMKRLLPASTILKLGDDSSRELAIQCGKLMHTYDPSFSEKIKEVISYFKVGDTSFLRNLLDISFHDSTDEERKAIFGFDILKLKNPIYIYFGSGDFLPNSAYHKSLENKKNRN